MKNVYAFFGIVMIISVVLSGCLYPESELKKNQMPNEAQLEMVQRAVTQYREETDGLVPIKTKENDVNYYEKYIIDFSALEEHQLLSEPPGTAYENGGVYQYTLIDPEDNPTVKLIDLRLAHVVRDVNTKLDIYRSKHTYPPFGKQIENGVYKLNYKKLGYKEEPSVKSPYTQNNLPVVIDDSGELFIDYRIDLQQAWEEYKPDYKEGEDIRSLLTDHYPFAPAYSKPYTINNDDVVFLHEKEAS